MGYALLAIAVDLIMKDKSQSLAIRLTQFSSLSSILQLLCAIGIIFSKYVKFCLNHGDGETKHLPNSSAMYVR
jgi:hypothetical protein